MSGILEGIKRSVREKVRSGKEILRVFRELRKEETKEMLALFFRKVSYSLRNVESGNVPERYILRWKIHTGWHRF